MIDIGEDLVGAYLRVVHSCELVAFNTRTGKGQAEIDVIGVRLEQGGPRAVWLCEVSTHTRGLGGYRGDPVTKLAAKLSSVREYADEVFPGVKRHVEFWSPRVRPGLLPGLTELNERDGVTLVINGVYANRVSELVASARVTTAYSDHPSFRMLQILTCLTSNPMS
ncbi:MAG: hypothetical protein ABJA81_01360 [Nocardioidaceae bacterium]